MNTVIVHANEPMACKTCRKRIVIYRNDKNVVFVLNAPPRICGNSWYKIELENKHQCNRSNIIPTLAEIKRRKNVAHYTNTAPLHIATNGI